MNPGILGRDRLLGIVTGIGSSGLPGRRETGFLFRHIASRAFGLGQPREVPDQEEVEGDPSVSRRRFARSAESIQTNGSIDSIQGDLAEQLEVAQQLAGAQNNRGQGIVGNRNRQPGLVPDAAVEVFEHGPAPR